MTATVPPAASPVSHSPDEHWIVVGAGSAGCVVARRLVDAGRKVTLIEAGPSLEPDAVPASIAGDNSFAAMLDDRLHIGLAATRARGREPTPYLRGRGVGGSSAVNAMVGLVGDERQYRALGIDDLDVLRSRLLVPTEPAELSELGPIDRALLDADPAAERAPLTRHDRRRVTSAEAYLWPVLDAENLELLTESPVDRLMVGANGVEGVRLVDGTELDADRVVLCAGAIHSPTILLRSAVAIDGVGEGLQDHAAAALLLETHPDPSQPTDAPLGLATASLLDDDPIQILAMNHLGASDSVGMLMVALMRPMSRSGTVRLRSDDPLDHPIVDFDLLSDPRDVATLRQGVRRAIDLLGRPSFAAIVDRVLIDDVGTPIDALDTDDDIDRWLLERGADYVHASGTCAMGRVVDQHGALIGLPGGFVCDASVFPSIPNVNTHIPTTLLAEHLVGRWLA